MAGGGGGYDGADNNKNKITINKCGAAEAEEDNSRQEAGCSGGGRGATVVQQWRRNSFAIRSRRMEVEDGRGCVMFLFLGVVESYLNESFPKPSVFFSFRIRDRIKTRVILWSFLVILTQNLPQSYHKSYLKIS
jgi:hypothetical protein